MIVLSLLPVVVSALVLAAHFLRAGRPVLVLASLAIGAVALVRRTWAARAAQVGLLLGAAEWVRTLAALVGERREAGRPFVRLTIILGAVMGATALSALVFTTRAMRKRYGLGEPTRNGRENDPPARERD